MCNATVWTYQLPQRQSMQQVASDTILVSMINYRIENGNFRNATLEITNSEIEIEKLAVWNSPSRPPYKSSKHAMTSSCYAVELATRNIEHAHGYSRFSYSGCYTTLPNYNVCYGVHLYVIPVDGLLICPFVSCHTLSEIAINSSLCFDETITLTFQPGNHLLDSQLSVSNILSYEIHNGYVIAVCTSSEYTMLQ